MEGYVGEIRLMANNYAPRNWMYCQGQTIQIRTNTALFSILGIQYGGDGANTFMLPNFAGRVAIGNGQAPGLSNYANGNIGGLQSVALSPDQMPAHMHGIVYQQQISGQIALNATSGGGADSPVPDGCIIAGDASTNLFYSGANAPMVAMSPKSISGGTFTIPAPTITNVSQVGGNAAHNNMQPYLGLSCIVCTTGYFPARN